MKAIRRILAVLVILIAVTAVFGKTKKHAKPDPKNAESLLNYAEYPKFDHGYLKTGKWLVDAHIVNEKPEVTARDLVGSWAFLNGHDTVAVVNGSGDIISTKGTFDFVIFDFFDTGSYRIRYFGVYNAPNCAYASKQVQVGTYRFSGNTLELEAKRGQHTGQACSGPWKTFDDPPKKLTYTVTKAGFDQIIPAPNAPPPAVKNTGLVLHGPCFGLDRCHTFYMSARPFSPGYNLQQL